MCHECLQNHPHFCPECLIQLKIGSSQRNSIIEIKWIFCGGAIAMTLFLIYALLSDIKIDLYNAYFWYVFISFGLGISIVGTYFILRNSEFYKDLQNIPFIGLKLTFLFPVIVTLSTVPIFYFFYLLFEIIVLRILKKPSL
mgnify:CR=1 FL=1